MNDNIDKGKLTPSRLPTNLTVNSNNQYSKLICNKEI